MMIEGKTETGFAFAVDERVITDFRFVELASDLNSRDDQARGKAILAVPGQLLGADGKRALLEHCRDEDGYVPIPRVVKEISNILSLCARRDGDVKRS